MSVIFNGEEVIPDDCQVFHDGHEVAYIIFNGGVVYESPPDAPPEILPERITVRAAATGQIFAGSLPFARNSTVPVTIEILPANATNKSFTCESSKPNIVSVTATGENTANIKAVKAGSSVRVTFSTVNGITAWANVTVQ